VASARCHPDQPGFAIDHDDSDDGLEIGDAIPDAAGAAVGIVRRTAAGRVAGVAVVPVDGGALRVVDLGPTLGDGPPPRLASRAGDIVAAVYAVPRTGAQGGRPTRDLTVYSVGTGAADLRATPLGSIREGVDDSLAFDLAWQGDHGIAVYDTVASAPHAPRGVVRAAAFSVGQPAGPIQEVSPPDSDAEAPRIVPNGDGFLALWIARSIDASAPAPDSSDLEAPGEQREHGWIELAAVDERGAPRGPVRRLTPPGGHVTAYDVQRIGPGPKGTLLVVARDDGEVVDGSGGALLRVRVTGDVIDPPVAFSTDGLGRGAPGIIGGRPVALAWVAAHEQLRMLPLDQDGTPTSSPSAEAAMDEARPLLWLAAGRMLVATPADADAQLQTFACAE